MRDLLIGAADNYDWTKIRTWAKSARAVGFDGDIALIAYRLINEQEIVENCKALNIQLIKATADSFGNSLVHAQRNRDTICHQMRFFHLWQYLTETHRNYRYVIPTDVRDVVFQSNPSEWLLSNLHAPILAPSESILFEHEAWNKDNIFHGYGPYVTLYNNLHIVFNVGTIAGESSAIQHLSLILYSMGEHRYIPNDQSSFNILAHGLLRPLVQQVYMDQGWSCQCATMFEKAENKQFLIEKPPILKEGIAYTPTGEKFVMVHQYDRIEELKKFIEPRYE